nr:neurturin isoform X2 [Anser cygnoides]
MHLMRLPAVRDAWDEDISLSPLSPTGTHQPRATFAFSLRSTAWGFSTSLCLSFPTAKLDQSRGWRGWAGDTGLGVREGATGEGRIIRIFVLPVLQSFNVLTCSKMKVWKFAAIASMLLSSMLSILVCRDMFNGSRTYSPLPSSLSSRASSSSLPAAPRRPPRALPRHSSLLAQYSSLFESYTEGEIRQLISALVERYSQAMNSGGHELPLFPKAGNRMKRARARHKPCALKELEVSVSELGLGYESDETVLFRYCSGTCDAAVRNYDLSLKSVRSKRRIRKEKVRARPCCRPLSYDDDVSFLDAYNRYYTVNELSAKECGCV